MLILEQSVSIFSTTVSAAKARLSQWGQYTRDSLEQTRHSRHFTGDSLEEIEHRRQYTGNQRVNLGLFWAACRSVARTAQLDTNCLIRSGSLGTGHGRMKQLSRPGWQPYCEEQAAVRRSTAALRPACQMPQQSATRIWTRDSSAIYNS